jgi:ABC-type multidrug transport system ATPase subunit
MNVVVESTNLQLSAGASKASFKIVAGSTVAVMGEAASGKSLFLRAIAGVSPIPGGKIRVEGTALYTDQVEWNRRTTPQAICRKSGGAKNPTLVAEALTAVGLWDARLTPFCELTRSQQIAARLLTCLMSSDNVILVDGLLDGLSLSRQSSVLDFIARKAHHGQCWIVATHLPSVAQCFSDLLLLKEGSVLYFGKVSDFLSNREPIVIEVQTTNTPSVRTLVDPFAIDIEERPHGLRLRARKGQNLAAKLLVQGYGDVKLVTLRQPTLEDLLKTTL